MLLMLRSSWVHGFSSLSSYWIVNSPRNWSTHGFFSDPIPSYSSDAYSRKRLELQSQTQNILPLLLLSSTILFILLFFSNKEPHGFKSAIKDPKWLSAMKEEMHALKSNQTWVLVPRPTGSNVVGSKSVFQTKYNYDGSLDRFKACLVVQWFTQVSTLDYSLTFSPVVKASTFWIVLSLAALNKWPLHQLDVKNAFFK